MTHRYIREGRLDLEPLAAELGRFLALVMKNMRLDVQFDVRLHPAAPAAAGAEAAEEAEVVAAFRGRDQDLLLQHNAELLNAIEYIAMRWLHLDPHFYDHVRLDCAEYRVTRIEELKLSARVAADRVRESRQPFRFNPMSPRERRVLHLAVKDVPGVRSASEGAGEQRQVVLYPAEK